jgi:quercetin dioxygenase-like cupin family protein
MPTPIRRVVTGHDANGKAIVLIDDITPATSTRPGTQASVVWTTQGFPVNNDTSEDTSGNATGTTLAGGTVFRIVEFGPGNTPRNHRTDSIDYAVVMSGEIDMEMDGAMIHIKAGDVLVQRGTVHNWINSGSEPCIIAFSLIDAKSVEAGGKVLEAHG